MPSMSKTRKSSQPRWVRALLLAVACCALVPSGCLWPVAMKQTTIGGQTLPSAFYLEDDVGYWPKGPEFLLSNQAQALEEYKFRRQAIQGGQPPAP